MIKNIRIIFLVIFSFMLNSQAQNGAALSGKIRDLITGAPLSGTSIILPFMSAQLEDETDSTGYFSFVDIEPGSYQLMIVINGFLPVILEEVLVEKAMITDLNISIDTSGETIKLQHVSGTHSDHLQYTLDRKSRGELPVRDINNFLTLFPSVWQQNDRIHIRGGRSDETAYYVNGLPLSDPLDNSFAGYIIPEAIETISVLPGGYAARYGLANSGIVMTRLRRGTPELKFSLDLHTDKFADAGEKFLNTYSYQDRYIIAQASGPLYWNRLRFYAAYENTDIGDAAKRFSQGFYFPGLVDRNPSSSSVYLGYPDTVTLVYPDGFTPDHGSSRWALNAILNLDLYPVQIELLTLVDHQKVYDSRIPMLDLLNTRKFHTESKRLLIQGGLTHRLGPSTVYSLHAAHFNRESERFDDITGNDWLAWTDTALIQQVTGRRYRFEDNYYPLDDRYQFGGIQFSRDGIITADYLHQKQTYFTLAAAITHQISRGHTLHAGLDWRTYTLRYYQIRPSAGWYLRTGGFGSDPEYYLASYLTNLYGYDLYGNESDNGLDGPREPSFFSVYLEDRLQFKDVLLSVGLRLDRLNNDDRILINPSDPQISGDQRGIAEEAWQVQDPMWYLSPRIALAVSAGPATELLAGISRLVQPPPLRNSYYATYIYNNQLYQGGFFYSQPIGFDLTAIKTKTIDIGIRQRIASTAELTATVFYKNTSGQIRVQRRFVPPYSNFITYFYMTNLGTSEIRGIDLSFILKRTKQIRTVINYTYTSARGTASTEDDYYATLYRGAWFDTLGHNYNNLSPLDFVPVHQVTFDIDYRYASNEGGPVFRNFGVNLLLRGDSGHPFTKTYVPPGG